MGDPIPTARGLGILNAYRFGKRTLPFLERVQAAHLEAVRIPIPLRAPLVIVTDPALVHDALSRPEAFERPPTLEAVSLIAEHGLVQSEGDRWQQQRRVMTPGFTGERVVRYADATGERLCELVDRWRERDDPAINLHRELTSLSLRVATEVLLGVELTHATADEFYDWMQVAGREFEFGIKTVAPPWLPLPISREFRRAAGNVRQLSEDLIARRREALGESGDVDPPDVLGRILRATERADPAIPPDNVVDHVATLLIAGHETTALSVGYALGLLSWHPDAADRVRREADRVLGDEQPAHRHVVDLTATRRAYDETLRLYPPAWAVFRRATADVSLGRYVVDEDAAVVFPQWSIHRDPRYFEDPDRFDPERWTTTDPADTPAYFPFASGTHACIGRQFAISGAPLSIAGLLRTFDVEVPRDAFDDLRVTPTLRPVDGIAATVTPRR